MKLHKECDLFWLVFCTSQILPACGFALQIHICIMCNDNCFHIHENNIKTFLTKTHNFKKDTFCPSCSSHVYQSETCYVKMLYSLQDYKAFKFFLSKEAKRDNIWICFTQLHKLSRRKTEEHYDKAPAQMSSVPCPCFTLSFYNFFAIKIRYARSVFFGY